MKDKIRIIANIPDRAVREELEVPDNITANELIMAFDRMYASSGKQDTERLRSEKRHRNTFVEP